MLLVKIFTEFISSTTSDSLAFLAIASNSDFIVTKFSGLIPNASTSFLSSVIACCKLVISAKFAFSSILLLFESVWACKSFSSLRITCGMFSNNNFVKSSILLFTSWAKSVTVELSDINVRFLLTITCSLSSLRSIKFASITPAFVISVGITKINSPLVKFSGGIITKPELLLLVYWYVSFNEWPVKSISPPLSSILTDNVLALTSPCIIWIGCGKSLLTVSHTIALFLKLSKLIKKYHYC